MSNSGIQLEQLQTQNEKTIVAEKVETAIKTEELKTFQSAIDSQATITHVGWADTLSKSVRPIITYWFMVLYCASKTVTFMLYLNTVGDFTSALQQVWTESDQALWAGVLNFWFLGRVFEKHK